ncbi:MAG: GNAT family N-acetyltransferase, partial [Pseudomonadota bacterium]
QAFLENCRAELTLGPENCRSPDLIVAERNGTMVGMAEIAVDDQECQLDKLLVDPDQQTGGVGKQLLHWAADRARELGQSEMIIESDPEAEGFYKHCGAIPAGTVPSGSIAGRTLPRLILPLA